MHVKRRGGEKGRRSAVLWWRVRMDEKERCGGEVGVVWCEGSIGVVERNVMEVSGLDGLRAV